MKAPDALAYEINGQPVSRQAFYAAACDPQRPVTVEACAGAGKTWMLVSRILRALLAGALPHDILAITFTKKAAGEMRGRLHEWLERFSQADLPALQQELVLRGLPPQEALTLAGPLKDLYRQTLAAGRPVQIRTFHSWFAALLRTAPWLVLERLGLPARHELLENDRDAVALVWRRFHEALMRDPDARQDYEACIAALGRFQTKKALEAALDKRVEFGLADAQAVVERSVRPWQELFSDLAASAGVHTPADLLTQAGPVREALQEAARHLGRAPQPSFSAQGSVLEQALSSGTWDQAVAALFTQKMGPRKFGDTVPGIDQIRQAQTIMQRAMAAFDQWVAWQHHHRLARLTRVLIVQFAQLKRDEGWVDMNDLEQAALAMLSDPVLSGWMQQRLDARVKHLLIDEFQDTNPLQWQALHAWLSGYAGAGGGSAPSVFIVGDPKQSIYRFRRAEPQVFRAAQNFVVAGLGGDQLGCDHTHRNAPQVLEAMNQVMAQAQADGQYEGFRPHTTESKLAGRVLYLPQIARSATTSTRGVVRDVWRDSLTLPRQVAEERLITLECRQAAVWLAGRLGEGLAPCDVMVLARKRSRLVVMQDELRALGIASQQPEKTDLFEAPEVQDVVALLDVLVSTTHDLSLARALKSPIFSVPDDALVALATRAREMQTRGEPASWFDLLLAQDEALPEALQGVGAQLARWKQGVDQLPPHDALDAIFHQSDLLARYAQAAPPPLRESVLAHLRALLGAALQVGAGRYATPYALVRALRAGGVRAPAAAAANAVALLTVHGAKGLEAPLVLLLDTDAGAPAAQTMGLIVDWPGQSPSPQRFSFLAAEKHPPACCVTALEVEHRARKVEELNALYVAMTRARQELVISSVEPLSALADSWWQRLLPQAQSAGPQNDESTEATCADQPAKTPAARLPGFNLAVVPSGVMLRGHPSGANAAPKKSPELPLPGQTHSRFGQALHRLLECWPVGATTSPPALLQRVAHEFRLTGAAAQEAAAVALRILRGEGRWAWDPVQVDWAANEIELHHEGQLLRIDRLVRRREGGVWWVLDYKSAAQPEHDETLLAQMRLYQRAVTRAYPGEPVRTAFLTGQGRLVVVD